MQEQYSVEVRNRFSPLDDAEEDPTARYQRFIDANDAATKACVPQRVKQKSTQRSTHPKVIEAREKLNKILGKQKSPCTEDQGCDTQAVDLARKSL